MITKLVAGKPGLARPLSIVGGVLLIVGALLPWATFQLNIMPYPALSTLQFFDAPFGVPGFRLHVMLLGVAVIAVAFAPAAIRGRTTKALGWGALAIAVVNAAYLIVEGGGFGTITSAHGAFAFGAVVSAVAAVMAIVAGSAYPAAPPVTWDLKLAKPLEWLVLVLAYAALLKVVADTLTAGGRGGAANPYAGAVFLSFVAFLFGVFGGLNGTGLLRWVSAVAERHRAFSAVVLLACAFVLPFTEAGTEQWIYTATNIGVFAATAIGLNIVVGLAGLLDLGYVAFMGIGAFVAANLSGAASASLGVDLPFVLVLVIAAIVAGVFGAIVGSPTLRVRGDYLAIVTLAFGEIFFKAAQNNIAGATGGSNAIPGIPPLDFLGTPGDAAITVFGAELAGGVLYYLLAVVIVALVMVLFANLKSSRIGRAWIAVREDEDAARAMGVKTGKIKVLAFLVGAAIAGVAGAVLVHRLTTASYESFTFLESVTLLSAVILGGMGSIPGAVVGASLLFVLPEKLREFSDYRLMLFGLALVLIMRFRPQGLIPDKVRRAELAGETAEGGSLKEAEERAVAEQERADDERLGRTGVTEGRS
ncbi:MULTISPECIES: branched-chain amino acid ABC transporter permease [Actinokineospora]|uniref:Branched-chain amino acid ABC transporter permease n=1 Tax=Actinokineospora fastidiosa TaxID=1816 RepID=A0A918GGC3_9PSEU|nr:MULTISPECIES: branched-chain amino acid ABC transporter permease [Actinokineospora]UVS80332.1 LIV-I protein H [Actinokineospora sp. UTMC 2448]GGS34531.1 hypothetical protein GCM10010171_31220 [Actinokineospora fastidiosa]